MTLTKDDLKKITKVVNTGNQLIGTRLDKFESYVRKRFDEVDTKFDKL